MLSTTYVADRLLCVKEKIFIRDLARHLGQHVTLYGWFVTLRRAKALRFLVMRDRTGTVQAIHRGGDGAAIIDTLLPESAVRITGIVRETAAARFGAFEIEIETIDVLARAAEPLPIDAAATPDERLDSRFLDLRAPEKFLIFEVQTTLETAFRELLIERGFAEIHTPKITAGGSESGAAVFELPYFDETACLVQSPQFYVQMAMAAGFDRAFEVGPVFRAETAVTHRHATEFTCLDVEMSWIDSHEELMSFEEELLSYALRAVRDRHGADIERHFGVPVEIPEESIPRIPLARALELVGGSQGPAGREDGCRLTQKAEQTLSKYVRERHGHSFVFVTDYPANDRPFYTKRKDGPRAMDAPVESLSFDLLWRGIEITSGCQREHRYDRLRAQIVESGIESQAMERYLERYYLEMFRFGCPPHGGFGIGLDRLLMTLLAQSSIRETSFVFRGPGRYVP